MASVPMSTEWLTIHSKPSIISVKIVQSIPFLTKRGTTLLLIDFCFTYAGKSSAVVQSALETIHNISKVDKNAESVARCGYFSPSAVAGSEVIFSYRHKLSP